jgi:hypothetical protein
VWALRALVDSLFRLVLMAQRALSRDMEMQADLVAVSLAGSDALIEALHKMPAADDAWDRSLQFMRNELADKRITHDVFAIQARVLELVGRMLDQPDHGRTPPRPADARSHRLFKAELAQPPRMWATHPQSHEREENAKRVYLDAPVDTRSAWALFDTPEALRARATGHLLGAPPDGAEPVGLDVSLRKLEAAFDRRYHDRAYRGMYLSRSPVLEVASAQELSEPLAQIDAADLDDLYPASLAAELERLRELEKERTLLVAVRDGVYIAQGGVVQFRGRTLRRSELPSAIAEADADLAAVRMRLRAQDKRHRSVHRAAARQLGGGWDASLCGTAALLHYAEHALADLRDAQGVLSNAVAAATATHRASKSDVTKVLQASDHVFDALEAIYAQAGTVDIGPDIATRLQWPGWAAVLGEFRLARCTREQINPWLQASRGWVAHAIDALSALRNAALEQLLESEDAVARQWRAGAPAEPAPAPPAVPAGYAIATPERARARMQKLHWWKRFQNAQGMWPALARTAIACAIVGGVLGAGWSFGAIELAIHNGLGRAVHVDIDGNGVDLAAHASDTLKLAGGGRHTVRTVDAQGRLIEAFDADVGAYGHPVYNVAGASSLVVWTATYGSAQPSPPSRLGNARWTTTQAQDVFSDPPRSMKTQGGGAIRYVLSAADASPERHWRGSTKSRRLC